MAKPNTDKPKKVEKKEDNLKKNDKDQSSEKEQSSIEPELLENMPPEIKRVVEMGFSMQRYTGPSLNPIMNKVNEGHIDRILDIVEKEDESSYKDVQSSKKYKLIYFILSVLFICFLIYFLIDKDKALLMSIIERGILVICGFGGGYGFKAYLDNKKRS